MNILCVQYNFSTIGGNTGPLPATKLHRSPDCRLPFFCSQKKKKKGSYVPAAVAQSSSPVPPRKTAEFHPSVWGNYFLTLEANDHMISSWTEQAEVLKEEVRQMLIASAEDHSRQLHLVDVLQRLGIAYLFEVEIEKTLQQIYNSYHNYHNDDNLDTVALRFRLLRQECYNVSSDVFNKFKDDKGKFKEDLTSDVQGMLSLHEASFHGLPGEDILDESLAFAKSHLTSMVTNLDAPLADHINHALKWPIHRNVTKHEELYFISHYELLEAHNKSLLKLAKLNFNRVQKLYQEELKSLSEWWTDLNFATKLPYSRDRLFESYFWALGTFSEPKCAFGRRSMGKFGQLITTMDDTFDVYGIIEELEILNETTQRWDTSMKDLQGYMKPIFETYVAAVQEIGDESALQGKPYCLPYVRKAVQDLVGAYMTEARWLKEGYVPTLEEYRQVASISTGYPLLAVAGICGMGNTVSKEVLEWLLANPKLLTVIGDHCRILNDLRGHEFEHEREHVASSVECYMKQYGVSKQEAYNELNKLIENDWKEINQEMIKQVEIPRPIREVFLNLARVADVIYKDFDGYTISEGITKDMLTALLVTPMTI